MGNSKSKEEVTFPRRRSHTTMSEYRTYRNDYGSHRDIFELFFMSTISGWNRYINWRQSQGLSLTYHRENAINNQSLKEDNEKMLEDKGDKQKALLDDDNHVLPLKTQYHFPTEYHPMTDCDKGDSSTGKYDIVFEEADSRKKQLQNKHEYEQEIAALRLKLIEMEEEKIDLQTKHEASCLKLVNDNRRMNESLSLIQDHVRREKIESEQTKDEVDRALQDRQKLIDEITALTKSFEKMISEKERLQIIMETSISTFERKLHERDEEIQNLHETIEHDRNKFEEERREYLTVIESLRIELLCHENRQIRIM